MRFFILFILCFSSLGFFQAGFCSGVELGSSTDMPEEGKGLKAEYYNGRNFEEKVFSRIDSEIDFYYRGSSPAPGVNTENYSIRWTGKLLAPTTGTYKLIVHVDDGVRVWLNEEKILDQWEQQQTISHSQDVNLEEGEYYDLKIEYFNAALHGVMRLLWESPEDRKSTFFGFITESPRRVIPGKYLFDKLPEHKELVDPSGFSASLGGNLVSKINAPSPEKVFMPLLNKDPEPESTENEIAQLIPLIEETQIYEDLRPGEVVEFKRVIFEQGKYNLLESSFSELEKLVRTMKLNPALKIRIDGHTDNVGDPKINQTLSYYRAKVVATYLTDKGISHSRIDVKGHGDSQPLADNSTEEGRAKNRRVEFIVR